jgi:hypothetical protein
MKERKKTHTLKQHKLVFWYDCTIDQKLIAQRARPNWLKKKYAADPSEYNHNPEVFEQFAQAAEDLEFRLWFRDEILNGFAVLEDHGVRLNTGLCLENFVIQAFHVYQLIKPTVEGIPSGPSDLD